MGEIPNPFNKDVKPRLPAGVTPKDYAKLGILIMGFAFMVVVMIALHRHIMKGFEEAAQRDKDKGLKIRDGKPKPVDARLQELFKLAAAFTDDETPTDVSTAHFHALIDFVGEREITDLADKNVTMKVIADSPEKLRGRVLRLTGTLTASRKIALQKPTPKSAWSIAESTIEVEGTGPVVVYTTALPEVRGEKPLVSFAGSFLRYVKAGDTRTPAFFARELIQQAAPPPPPGPEDPNAKPPAPPPQAGPADPETLKRLASEFHDGQDPLVKESQAFLTMMAAVHDVSGESFSKLAVETPPDMLILEPDKHRGEVVRIRGQLSTILTERLDATVPQNIEHMYYVAMQSYPKVANIHFFLIKWPDGLKLTPTSEKYGYRWYRDWIEIEGVFLRTRTYEGQSLDGGPGKQHRAGLLLVKNMRLIEGPKMPDARGSFIAIVFSIGGILAVTILAVGVWSRRFSKNTLRIDMAKTRLKKGEKLVAATPQDKSALGEEVPKDASPAAAPVPPSTATATEAPPPPPPAQ